MFQYPHLASTMEKTVAPVNLGRSPSTVGVTWCSVWMAALRSLGSKQSQPPILFPSVDYTVNPGFGFTLLKFCDQCRC